MGSSAAVPRGDNGGRGSVSFSASPRIAPRETRAIGRVAEEEAGCTHDDVQNEGLLELVLADDGDERVAEVLGLVDIGRGGRLAAHRATRLARGGTGLGATMGGTQERGRHGRHRMKVSSG